MARRRPNPKPEPTNPLPLRLLLGAEALAATLRERAGLGVGASPFAIAKALGLKVVRQRLPRCFLGICFPGQREILVAARLSPAEAAFTVGHELAEAHLAVRLPQWHEEFCDQVARALVAPVLGTFALQTEHLAREEWRLRQDAGLARAGIAAGESRRVNSTPLGMLSAQERAAVERAATAERTAERRATRRVIRAAARWEAVRASM